MRVDVKMSPAPFFSIVIPTYNRAELLAEALDSVIAQDDRDFELIVVDDGSTDLTEAVLDRYADDAFAFKQSNAGPGAARNAGAAKARGRYIAFLDSDDLWFPWTLRVFREVVTTFGEPSLVTSVPFEGDPGSHPPTPPELRCEAFPDFFSTATKQCSFGSGVALVRGDVFDQSGGFTPDRMNGEDLDFVLRIGDSPGFVQVNSPPLVNWRRHGGNLTSDTRKTAEGLLKVVSNERADAYPGGSGRRQERREIISRHARAAAISALKCSGARAAWRLYRETAAWHLRLARWKFLLGFPVATVSVGRSDARRVSPV